MNEEKEFDDSQGMKIGECLSIRQFDPDSEDESNEKEIKQSQSSKKVEYDND